ncbi:restriction endonuclease subunit S [Anaerotignum lactatifermentans]|uniref:restriction endonuclease subunit S n=1 Tax=Anaerotignum lactatifermentans TaxID=160404 RepID=UPI003AB62373
MTRLGDYTNIKTGKLDANASSDKGIYPFFTCSKEPLTIDTYSYDCECVLVAGNGDLNVKYYSGKFDAYQRTYIIESKNKDKLLVRYLYCFLDKYVETLREQSIGGVIKYIKLGNLTEAEIPLPPLEEQRKIAAVLDKVSDLIAKRRQQLEKLDLLVKARFVEMFGDFRINSMKWQIASFDEIATIDGNMTTDYQKYADYPHIGIDSIEKDTGELKGYRTVAEDGVISGKYIFTPKHIIYSKIRPNLNKVALPDFEGVCSADAYPILPIDNKCNRIFLAYNMRSPYFLEYILQFCNRTNLPKVNRKEVCGFKTPLPPLELQNQFSDFVERTEKTKTGIKESLEKLETLKKALMQKYFG